MDGFSYPIGDYDDDLPCPGPQMKLFQTVLWAILARAVPPARFPEETEVQTVMKGIDLPETTKPLLKLMRAFRPSARRLLESANLPDPAIWRDERLILAVIALHQHGRQVEAKILLRSVLLPDAAIEARESADELAAVLTKRRRWLEPPMAPMMQQTGLAA